MTRSRAAPAGRPGQPPSGDWEVTQPSSVASRKGRRPEASVGVAERASVRLPHRAARSPPVRPCGCLPCEAEQAGKHLAAGVQQRGPTVGEQPARKGVHVRQQAGRPPARLRTAARGGAARKRSPARGGQGARRSGRAVGGVAHTDRQWCRAHSATASPGLPRGGKLQQPAHSGGHAPFYMGNLLHHAHASRAALRPFSFSAGGRGSIRSGWTVASATAITPRMATTTRRSRAPFTFTKTPSCPSNSPPRDAHPGAALQVHLAGLEVEQLVVVRAGHRDRKRAHLLLGHDDLAPATAVHDVLQVGQALLHPAARDDTVAWTNTRLAHHRHKLAHAAGTALALAVAHRDEAAHAGLLQHAAGLKLAPVGGAHGEPDGLLGAFHSGLFQREKPPR